MRRKNIMERSEEKKHKIYERIDNLFSMGCPVAIRAHSSGFPAVTVDCKRIHIRTDILSIERWWKKKGEEDNGN